MTEYETQMRIGREALAKAERLHKRILTETDARMRYVYEHYCMPQIISEAKDAFERARAILAGALKSADDALSVIHT